MGYEIGIDLGTSHTLIHLKGRGIVLNEPSVVALDIETKELVAVGSEAYNMIGRTPRSIQIVRPIKYGVIQNFEIAEAMMVMFLERLRLRSWLSQSQVLVTVPSAASDVERTSVIEVIEKASSGRVYVGESSIAAAFGSGISYSDSSANMIVDVGAGVVDIAILTTGEILVAECLRIGGADINVSIQRYLESEHQLSVGEQTIEMIKSRVSSAKWLDETELEAIEVRGRDLMTGLPKSINIHSNHLYGAVRPVIEQIGRAIKRLLEDLEPEVSADVIAKGIVLTGGGSLMYHFDTYLTEYLGISVLRTSQPLQTAAIGVGRMLDLILTGKMERHHPTLKQRLRRFFREIKRRLLVR